MANYQDIMAIENETTRAKAIVDAFLEASMIPDPETAALYIADDVDIHFTGATPMSHPREMTAYNARRYQWVKKKMERTDVCPGAGESIVYGIGTLYGEWPNGKTFENNRYIDRFVIRDDRIVKIDVWNDSAERILKGESS